jgi:hypothetical protein
MIQQGVGYTVTNSSGGQSLTVDAISFYKETLPFFIYEDTTPQGARCFRINAGTFNNEFPTVGGVRVGRPEAFLNEPSATSIIVLRIPASETFFPAGPSRIELMSGTTAQENTEEEAFVVLGMIDVTFDQGAKKFEISNLVSGSLWGERFQCGEELEYWFSRI